MAMPSPQKLFNRNFVLLWQGQLVSQLGTQLHSIALMFWIKEATGSGSLMGLIMLTAMLPGVILGPLGGTIADRYSRKKIIVLTDLMRGLAVLSLAGVMLLEPDATRLLLIWLFVVTITTAILGAFFRPAISASIPDLVPRPRISAANSLNQSSLQVSVFIGQGVGGTLFRILGAPLLFLIDGISFVLSGISEMFIQIPQPERGESEGGGRLLAQFWHETLAGFHYVWQRRGMRTLFIFAGLLNFITAPIAVMLPFYVQDHLKVTTDWFGFLLAGLGLGTLIGYGLAGAIKMSGRTRGMLSIVLLCLLGLLFGSIGLGRSPLVALALFLSLGIASGMFNISIMTILQLTTPSEIRGRVFGLLETMAAGLMPIGMGLGGIVIDLVDHKVASIFLVLGIVMSAITLLFACDRHFRDFLASDLEQPGPTYNRPNLIE